MSAQIADPPLDVPGTTASYRRAATDIGSAARAVGQAAVNVSGAVSLSRPSVIGAARAVGQAAVNVSGAVRHAACDTLRNFPHR